MTFGGIDPGLSGGLGFITPDGSRVYETPTFEMHDGKKTRRMYDIPAMLKILESEFSRSGPGIVIGLEQIWSRPGQGVASMFRMGEGYGLWKGILATMRLPYELVLPQRWKRVMLNGLSGKDKGASRERAQALFPTLDFSKVKHDGIAESILIAEFMRRSQKA